MSTRAAWPRLLWCKPTSVAIVQYFSRCARILFQTSDHITYLIAPTYHHLLHFKNILFHTSSYFVLFQSISTEMLSKYHRIADKKDDVYLRYRFDLVIATHPSSTI